MIRTVFVPVWALLTAISCLAICLVLAARYLHSVRNSASLFRAVAEGASDGLVVMERDSKIIWSNAAYSQTMGYPHGALTGRYPLEFALPSHLAVSKEEARTFRFDEKEQRFGELQTLENQRGDGSTFMHEFSHAAIKLGGKPRFLLVGRDVSQRVARERALVAAEAKLKTLSRTDALTGLSNRYDLRRRLERCIRCGLPFAVIQFDLNGMKKVNDTFGHLAGDALLNHVAEVLKAKAEQGWVSARMGGDEFTVLLPDEPSLDRASRTAQHLVDGITGTFKWGSVTLTAEICAGVAIWKRGVEPDQILHQADLALYEAKNDPARTLRCYDDALGAQYEEAQAFEREVVAALDAKRFTFHFQPIVNLTSRKIEKFEMLIRWKHPEFGSVPPDKFLPVLERVGLTGKIDQLVIDRAVDAITKIDEAGLEDVGLSINLSPKALYADDFIDRLIWLADGGYFDPARVSIEILENTALDLGENKTPGQLLARLRDAQFKVFFDDFGMGYAGLAHLAMLPVSGLKIDKGLSSAVETDPASRRIVLALVELAMGLGLEVVAEGVETTGQMDIIQRAGCSMFQGYAVARPMPLDRVITWTRNDRSASATGTDG